MITYIVARPTKSEKATTIRRDVSFSEFRLTVAATMKLASKDLEMCYRLSTSALKKKTSLETESDYLRMVKEYTQVVVQKLKKKKSANSKRSKQKKRGKDEGDDDESAGVTIFIYDERSPAELKVILKF
jgi:hypothetical protein